VSATARNRPTSADGLQHFDLLDLSSDLPLGYFNIIYHSCSFNAAAYRFDSRSVGAPIRFPQSQIRERLPTLPDVVLPLQQQTGPRRLPEARERPKCARYRTELRAGRTAIKPALVQSAGNPASPAPGTKLGPQHYEIVYGRGEMLVKTGGLNSLDITTSAPGAAATEHRVYSKLKRGADILVVLTAGLAVFAVILLAAAAIYLIEGGPIFFVQDRVGKGGRVFRMFKLRTMVPESFSEQRATLKNDPRVTWLGYFLRQSHIDELPQVLNVLLGDMTLIGPRPEQPALAAQYREQLPNFDMRHTVTPGLTGLAQVSFGYAADVSETAKKLDYDLEYVKLYGPKMDLLIALQTFQILCDPRYVR
jgi:lipopolysaccharide/colanic/teichoic acid biosynthesis glycosyltransferase